MGLYLHSLITLIHCLIGSGLGLGNYSYTSPHYFNTMYIKLSNVSWVRIKMPQNLQKFEPHKN